MYLSKANFVWLTILILTAGAAGVDGENLRYLQDMMIRKLYFFDYILS